MAQNEAWFRDLNQRKAEWMESGDSAAGFRCECWQMDCTERIPLRTGVAGSPLAGEPLRCCSGAHGPRR